MKARVLAKLILAIGDPSLAGTYDVSAPTSVVFSPDPVPPPPPVVETAPVEGEARPRVELRIAQHAARLDDPVVGRPTLITGNAY